jgi:hypothetical protein
LLRRIEITKCDFQPRKLEVTKCDLKSADERCRSAGRSASAQRLDPPIWDFNLGTL